jgi:Protein NO VEIN, C-terminal
VAVRFLPSDFTGEDPYKRVWGKFNSLLPLIRSKLQNDPLLTDFAKPSYVSHYGKQGATERRYPWIGFIHRNHLKEFRDKRVCTQFQFGPTFWSIWIDYPASAARRFANENLEGYSDASLRRYFNRLGGDFKDKFGYEAWAGLYPSSDREFPDMNAFEKNLYGRARRWERDLSEITDSEARQFVVGMKQPKTGVYIGANPSPESLVELSKRRALVSEIVRAMKALLPIYLLLTGMVIPDSLKIKDGDSNGRGRRGGGSVLSTTSIDESARWAVEKAIEYERSQGRTPEDVSSRPVHYDLESKDSEGRIVRRIEVKGRRSHIPVVLTSGEYEEAKSKNKEYYLYVITSDHEGFSIRNPAETCSIKEKLVKVYEVTNWKKKGNPFPM